MLHIQKDGEREYIPTSTWIRNLQWNSRYKAASIEDITPEKKKVIQESKPHMLLAAHANQLTINELRILLKRVAQWCQKSHAGV